jgi:hypothetical protein
MSQPSGAGAQSEAVAIADLREAMAYDHDTGSLTWIVNASTSAKAGTNVGATCNKGYIVTKFKGVQLKAHRVAFALFHGRWPDQFLDHVNGVRSDNRICNLREASFEVNRQNTRHAQRNSQTGVLGVRVRRGRFVAQLQVQGRTLHLGTFDDAHAAHAAYVAAKRKHHPGSTL